MRKNANIKCQAMTDDTNGKEGKHNLKTSVLENGKYDLTEG